MFPNLVPCTKWKTENRNVEPGDIVLIKYPSIKIADYQLGEVTDINIDNRGLVRTVFVKRRRKNAREAANKYVPNMIIDPIGVQRLVVIVPRCERKDLTDSNVKKAANQPVSKN